jgi:hypothetical protein
MIKGIILNQEQKELLTDRKYDEHSYYNPVLDDNDNWIISEVEVNNTINSDFSWVKEIIIVDLKTKEYPKIG